MRVWYSFYRLIFLGVRFSSMKWTEFKKKFLELCDFNNIDINDVSVVKKYWERGYTVEETYEIWEDGV